MAGPAKLTQGSIAGHLFTQTYPLVFGVAAIMSVGIIDAYFLGQLGNAELAAISFIFPVATALSSLGVGVMAGVGSVVSRALGEGDSAKAARRGNIGIAIGLGVGIIVAVLLLLLSDPLFRLLGASERELALIDEYMTIFACAFPLLLLMMGMSGVLRGQGAAKRATAITVSYAVANWILDPILIGGAFGFPGMGMAGAAWATLAGWALGVAVAIRAVQSSEIPLDPAALRGGRFRPAAWSLTRVAGPAAFSNSINPVGLSVLTGFLALEGAGAVAGYGAGGRLQTFAVVPLLGLSGSIGAIVGQNWGAGRHDRARRALVLSGLFCLVYGLAAGLAFFLARDWLAAQFSSDPAVIAQTVRYFEIGVWGYAGYGLLIVTNGALNAIDRATSALVLSMARVLLVMVPFAWFLRPAWGPDAIYAAELASNIAGALLSLALLVWVFRKVPAGAGAGARAPSTPSPTPTIAEGTT